MAQKCSEVQSNTAFTGSLYIRLLLLTVLVVAGLASCMRGSECRTERDCPSSSVCSTGLCLSALKHGSEKSSSVEKKDEAPKKESRQEAVQPEEDTNQQETNTHEKKPANESGPGETEATSTDASESDGESATEERLPETAPELGSESAPEPDRYAIERPPLPQTSWLIQLGGKGPEESNVKTALDTQGNLYVAGQFANVATFGTLQATSAGIQDVFVAKLNASGIVQWVQTLGGSNKNEMLYGLGLDGNGNVYLSGSFQSNIVSIGTFTLTNKGGEDIYIAKLDPTGKPLWLSHAGGAGLDEANGSLHVDAKGNATLAGSFHGSTISFGSTTLTKQGSIDGFVTQYDTAGKLRWARQFNSTQNLSIYDLQSGPSDSWYLVGLFKGNISFPSTTLLSSGNSDGFVVQMKQNGSFQPILHAKGPNQVELNRIRGEGNNLYLAGQFLGTLQVGSYNLTSKGAFDTFVMKLQTSPPSVTWIEQGRGGGNIFPKSIAVKTSGATTYLCGSFQPTQFSLGGLTLSIPGSQNIQGFLSKLNTQGTALWLQQFGGQGNDYATHIVTDSNGSLYVVGTFEDTATFGTSTLTSRGDTDIFVWKLR